MTLVDADTGEICERKQERRPVDSVIVGDRLRSELGDLEPLKQSMAKRGLINPLAVLDDGTLICGERRLAAARALGWSSVTVRVWPSGTSREEAQAMEVEENECRVEMAPKDASAYYDRIKMTRTESAKNAINTRHSTSSHCELVDQPKGKAIDRAVKDTGVSKRVIVAYNKLKNTANNTDAPDDLRRLASDLMTQVDNGEVAVTTAVRKLKDAEAQPKIDKSADAVAKRVTKAKEMAAEGYTSRQIAKTLGISEIAGFLKRNDITVPADAVTRKTRRIDPAKVVENVATDLDHTVVSLDVLDDNDLRSLDPADAEMWAKSMSDSIRSLKRFTNRLKEMTQ